jgi:4'-phosphopantetheinyl transferase
VVVAEAHDAYVLLREVVAERTGAAADLLLVDRAPCPSCGGPHGRPLLRGAPGGPPQPYVSVASSGPLVAVAVSASWPVGVDVESFDGTGFAGFREVALHPDEREHVRGAAARATVWARKEAVLKAAGVGLLVDPATVVVSAPGTPAALLDWPRDPHRVRRPEYLPLPDPGSVRVVDVEAPAGYAAAVAVVRPPGPGRRPGRPAASPA